MSLRIGQRQIGNGTAHGGQFHANRREVQRGIIRHAAAVDASPLHLNDYEVPSLSALHLAVALLTSHQ
jgi:hypothetical protein